VFLSLCYVMLRRALQLAVLCFRPNECKELEIVVLRHELGILRRKSRRASWWRDAGRTAVDQVDRRSVARSVNSSCVWPARIRGGDTNALSAS
jgi:hypothetical protein